MKTWTEFLVPGIGPVPASAGGSALWRKLDVGACPLSLCLSNKKQTKNKQTNQKDVVSEFETGPLKRSSVVNSGFKITHKPIINTKILMLFCLFTV